MDHGETANKCTIAPLAYRSDFELRYLDKDLPIGRLNSQILLHPDGELLHHINGHDLKPKSLAAIDCVWNRLPILLQRLEKPLPILAKIPDGFVTAYPRRDRNGQDPQAGLATIEALFIAAALLGEWNETLLREYYFAERFLDINALIFAHYDVEAKIGSRPIYQPVQSKNSHTRRVNRGRASR